MNPMINNPMQAMQNNPIMQMMNIARSGGNPMQLLQQMAMKNPRASQAMQMIQGKNQQQLRSMAENMCKERGISVEQVAQQLGMQMPSGN